MAISLSDLSPKAQEQAAIKLAILEARKRKAANMDKPVSKAPKGNKLHAEKVEGCLMDGTPFTFASKREYKRYGELAMMAKAGQITDLQVQVKYVLIPAQREPDYVDYSKSKHGRKVRGKLLEEELSYIADFVYQKDGKTVVEDSKGYRNPASATYRIFVIKRKLMRYLKGIEIQEV